jgi:hypothetical protein
VSLAFQELDGNPTTVTIDGQPVSTFDGSWDELPALTLTDPVVVVPTFTPTATLTNQTAVDLGFRSVFDIAKAGYKLKIPSGCIFTQLRQAVTPNFGTESQPTSAG